MDAILTAPINLPQIAVADLGVTLNGNPVLRGINLTVRKGEFLTIVGQSGSGKTTLLNAISGFIAYDGSITMPKAVGVVFQDHSIFPWMTVAQNIAFGLESVSEEARQATVARYIKLVGLEGRSDSYPGELSGGQVQRVGIARAFAADPEVVLMDEPYGSLDHHTRMNMQRWLLDVWTEQNKTIVFVTHDIGEAVYLSDRVAVLANGAIRQEFRPVFKRPRELNIKFNPEFIELEKEILDSMVG